MYGFALQGLKAFFDCTNASNPAIFILYILVSLLYYFIRNILLQILYSLLDNIMFIYPILKGGRIISK